MKRWLLFACIIFATVAGAAATKHFWFGKTMSVEDVVRRGWGKEEFNAKRFKNGTVAERRKMTVSLIRQKKQWLGKSRQEILDLLGSHNGFYFSDMMPAYIVDGGSEESKETWQVVFLLDNDYKVSDLIVQLNCCDS